MSIDTVESQMPEEVPEQTEQTEQTAEETVLEALSAPEETVPPDVTHRLAEDFLLLNREFPAIQDPNQLPDEVLDTAVAEDIPLLDAYLRFRWQEEKRVRAEEERRRQAAACSTGSLYQSGTESHPEQDTFLRAFRTALR